MSVDTYDSRLSPLGKVREAAKRSDVAYLIDALTDTDVFVRREAAYRLGEARSEAAVSPLCRLLSTSDAQLRVLAVIALGRIGDDKAIPTLYELAVADDAPVGARVNAMAALGELGDRRAVSLLGSVVANTDLGTNEGLPTRDRRAYRRWAAARLAELRDADAIPVLERAKHGAPVRDRIAFRKALRSLRRV